MSAPWSCWRSQSVGPIGHDAEYPQRTLAAIRAHMSNRAWQNPRYVSEGETLTFNIFILQVFKYYQVIIACVFISSNLRPLRATHLTGSSFSTRRSAAGRPMELMLGIRTVGLLRGWKTGAPPTLESAQNPTAKPPACPWGASSECRVSSCPCKRVADAAGKKVKGRTIHALVDARDAANAGDCLLCRDPGSRRCRVGARQDTTRFPGFN